MSNGTFFTVSRKWHEPNIRVDVTSTGIGITITFEDYLRILSVETGVSLDTLLTASEKVIDAMKRETAKVM